MHKTLSLILQFQKYRSGRNIPADGIIYLATVPSQGLLQKIVARAAYRIGLLPFNGKSH